MEKCFKAILEEREKEIPNIHNLVTLLGRIEVTFMEAVDADMLDRLNQLYIEARYPGELGLLPEGKPSRNEARRFHEFARDIYRSVERYLEAQA